MIYVTVTATLILASICHVNRTTLILDICGYQPSFSFAVVIRCISIAAVSSPPHTRVLHLISIAHQAFEKSKTSSLKDCDAQVHQPSFLASFPTPTHLQHAGAYRYISARPAMAVQPPTTRQILPRRRTRHPKGPRDSGSTSIPDTRRHAEDERRRRGEIFNDVLAF